MAQITIYVPDDLAERLKQRAKAEGVSVSSYLTGLARKSVEPDAWPDGFFEQFGAGTIEEAEELPFEEREHPELR